MKFDFNSVKEKLNADQLNMGKLKESWQGLSEKSKKIVLGVCGGTIAAALLLTVYLSVSKNQYKVLFPGMSNEESTQVYAMLQEMNAQPEIDSGGQVLVPADQWDNLVFQLNAQGYPRTTLSYDTFSSVSGFTSTEFERRTALIYQSQDRMQQTLLRQEGIIDATVTFTVPETSNYIWDQANQQRSSAGVTVTMKYGYTLSPERVSAIKHLAATSIPNLSPDDVVVIDAATGKEMPGLEDTSGDGYYSVQRLEYEREIAKGIEDSVVRLLSGKYGPDGVTAVATVTLDYDKMMSESKQYTPRDGAASGVINHYDERYSLGGTVAAEGIVGEEDNTDAPPIYPNEDGSGDVSATDYYKNIDYDVSYILTQIERGEPILAKATVAVVVNDPNFDTETEETLEELISKAVNISVDNIKVTNLNFATQQTDAPIIFAGLSQQQLLIIGLLTLLLLIIIIVVVLLLSRGKKKKKEKEAAEAMAVAQEAEAAAEAERQRQLDLQKEIEEHKKKLQNEALAQAVTKESAVTDEVREFAHENPELTASLLRSLMREEK